MSLPITSPLRTQYNHPHSFASTFTSSRANTFATYNTTTNRKCPIHAYQNNSSSFSTSTGVPFGKEKTFRNEMIGSPRIMFLEKQNECKQKYERDAYAHAVCPVHAYGGIGKFYDTGENNTHRRNHTRPLKLKPLT